MAWVWPFTTQSTSQYGRIDQGWDIDTTAGAPIVAIDSGLLGLSGPAPSKGSFGLDYPWLRLATVPPGAPSDTVYYGHAHVSPDLVGQNVIAGQVIGHVNTVAEAQFQGTSPGHLEIGFAAHDSGVPIAPLAGGMGAGTLPSSAGALIKQFLTGAVVDTTTTGGTTATTTPASKTPNLDAAATTVQNNATVDLPDPRNNKPFSPAFLGQSVPGGTLGGFRFETSGIGISQGGTVYPETGLVRGGMSEMDLNGARPRGPFQVFFMINPESISFSYQIQTDNVAPQSQNPAIQAIQSYPIQNQGISFDIIFNRMYEVWQGNYPGPSDIGCRWDVRAIERLMGMFDDNIGVKGLGKFESGSIPPLGLPVVCAFGGPNSFQFQGRINSLSAQYTMFDRNMVPIEAQVSISLLKVYISTEKTDLSTPLVQTYDPGTRDTNPPLKVGGAGGSLRAQ